MFFSIFHLLATLLYFSRILRYTKQNNIMNGYQTYLMIELAKNHGLIVHEQEYDIAWNEGCGLYNEFTTSEFNVDGKSEYDCIEEFLIKKEEDLKFNVDHRSNKEELQLNFRALSESYNGDERIANSIWSLINLKGYKRLDNDMTLKEMKEALSKL